MSKGGLNMSKVNKLFNIVNYGVYKIKCKIVDLVAQQIGLG
jgi:hypothetical protein